MLAIDLGTTSVRAMLFGKHGGPVGRGVAQTEYASSAPQVGWLEQDGNVIWDAVRSVRGVACRGTASSRRLERDAMSRCQQAGFIFVSIAKHTLISLLVQVVNEVLKGDVRAADVAAIGITNQRETSLLWDRTTGKPYHNAIVWSDTRTTATCEHLAAADRQLGKNRFRAKTGLPLHPYFSGRVRIRRRQSLRVRK